MLGQLVFLAAVAQLSVSQFAMRAGQIAGTLAASVTTLLLLEGCAPTRVKPLSDGYEEVLVT